MDDFADVKTTLEQARHQMLERINAAVELAVGETVILLHPPLPLLGVSIGMERGCQ